MPSFISSPSVALAASALVQTFCPIESPPYLSRKTINYSLTAPAHQVEELAVGLGGAHLLEHHLHRFNLIHVVEKLAQDSGFLQNIGSQQQLFTPCAAAVELDLSLIHISEPTRLGM